MLLSLVTLISVITVCSTQYQQWPPVVRQQKQMPSSHNLNGNVGVYGSGSGDVYAGKLGDGLYGMGTRFGGVAGITGSVEYAGGQRGKRAIVISRLTGSATGDATQTDDMIIAMGAVKGAANIGFGDESAEESAETSTQTATTSTTSKQEEETTKIMKKTVCSPRKLRAGR
ncbi:hypothetical protein PRIPAC_81951 [Pristionchus pacificus]|uniref:Uncharacterized protein n=1 Tax=Pristionchus pacificus TaxID=54126 RepID=A0A2A6C1P7_PRIPA|nr:hypothetical protein PRIPAC_81951 [Pristionchus pacificus]|eukprot:PDM72095.1 hypothetical protein PRIPAC_38529 [Pristionchus pacificus]